MKISNAKGLSEKSKLFFFSLYGFVVTVFVVLPRMWFGLRVKVLIFPGKHVESPYELSDTQLWQTLMVLPSLQGIIQASVCEQSLISHPII